jgi:iron complex outermembrane receptor protein
MINYVGPEASWGQLEATFNATFLDEYIERTANIGGGETSLDRAGTITSETFERAFPELRWTTNLGWTRDRWAAAMSFRWTDEMTDSASQELDSVLFTDLRVTYTPAILDDGLTVSVGFNNVFDEDPPILSTSTINQSISMHDLQGTVGYLRVSWEP